MSHYETLNDNIQKTIQLVKLLQITYHLDYDVCKYEDAINESEILLTHLNNSNTYKEAEGLLLTSDKELVISLVNKSLTNLEIEEKRWKSFLAGPIYCRIVPVQHKAYFDKLENIVSHADILLSAVTGALKEFIKTYQSLQNEKSKHKVSSPNFPELIQHDKNENVAKICKKLFDKNSHKITAYLFIILHNTDHIKVLRQGRRNFFRAWFTYIGKAIPKSNNVIDHYIKKDKIGGRYSPKKGKDSDYHSIYEDFIEQVSLLEESSEEGGV